MRSSLLLVVCACGALGGNPQQLTPTLPGESKPPEGPARGLGRGAEAPDFALEDSDGRMRGLGELHQGGPVLLYFYPGSYSAHARAQLERIQAKGRLVPAGAFIVGISPDSRAVSAKLHDDLKLGFPLLSDPDLRAARAYRVADQASGMSMSTFFVVDKAGKIRWSYVVGEGRLAEDAALDELRRSMD